MRIAILREDEENSATQRSLSNYFDHVQSPHSFQRSTTRFQRSAKDRSFERQAFILAYGAGLTAPTLSMA